MLLPHESMHGGILNLSWRRSWLAHKVPGGELQNLDAKLGNVDHEIK